MAGGVLAALGGLGPGLAKGIETGIQQQRLRQQLQEEQQQAKMRTLGGLAMALAAKNGFDPSAFAGPQPPAPGAPSVPMQPAGPAYSQPQQPPPSMPMPGAPGRSMQPAMPQGGSGSQQLAALLQRASSTLPQGYSARIISADRPGATVAGTGGTSQHAENNAIDVEIVGPQGPIPNTGTDTTGLYGKLALAMRGAADPATQRKLAWGGNFTTGPANGPRDLMHLDLGGDRGRFGTLAQMAQQSGAPQVVQQAQQTAQQVAPSIPQSVMGRMGFTALARLIDQADPTTDPAVKFMTMEAMQKMLAPSEREQMQLYMMQNRQEFQQQLELMREGFRSGLATTTANRLDQRAADKSGQGGTILQRGDKTFMVHPDGTASEVTLPGEGGVHRVGSTAASSASPETQKFVAEGIANYQLPPLSGWAMKTPAGQEVMARVMQLNPDYQASNFTGKQSGARSVGNRSANLTMAANVAEEMIPLVKQTSHNLDQYRTQFPTINDLSLAVERGTGNEDVVRFMEQINTLKYAYARALNPTGVARVEDLKRYDNILNQGWTTGQIDAALDQIRQSLAAERRGVDKSMGASGMKPSGSATQAPAQGAPAVGTEQDGYRFKGGDPAQESNWEQVQ